VALLWQAAFPGGPSIHQELLEVALPICNPNAHWRVGRLYELIIMTLLRVDPTRAHDIVDIMPPGRARNKAARRLHAGVCSNPRPFFWVTAPN
jgi:hypothetical protein